MRKTENVTEYTEPFIEANVQGEYADLHNAKKSLEDLTATVQELESLLDMLKNIED